MPSTWLAIPYQENALRAEVSQLFGVEGLPSLVMIGPDGRVITTDGRTRIMHDPSGVNFPWAKPVEGLEGEQKIKETLDKKEEALIRYGCRSLVLRAVKEKQSGRLTAEELKGIKEFVEFMEREVCFAVKQYTGISIHFQYLSI